MANLDGYVKNSNSKPKITLDLLEKFLWDAANIMRGSIDSSEYKHFIFGLLFLKRLSDQFEEERAMVKGNPDDPDNYQFFVPERARWSAIRKVAEGIGASIDKAFASLEESNPDKLEGVLTPIEFGDPKRLNDTMLDKLIKHFSQAEFNLANSNLTNPDMLGQAYEYLIKQFADDGGKKGGEFYTPNGVVRTLVRILAPEEGMRVCDPACGSGGMLIECVKYLQEHGNNPQNLSLFGQEKNRNTWVIARMNILLHNILDARIENDDTMANPQLLEDNQLMLFNMVIANPMWNQKEWSREMFEKGDKFNRVIYGLPPNSSGDWMWVQHMFATLNDKGRMGVVLDNGALFRGNSKGDVGEDDEDVEEEELPKKKKSKKKTNGGKGGGEWLIRKSFLDDDWIEGVIALPPSLFYNTGSPGCLIIINKQKPATLKKKVFFIHAEKECEEAKAQSFLREEHIVKISDTYRNKTIVDKFSVLVDIDEIRENDYNLNVSRYVDILAPEEEIDIDITLQQIRTIIKERTSLESKFNQNMKDLNYE